MTEKSPVFDKRKKIILFTCIIQLIIISFQIYNIDKRKVIGITVSPIRSEDIIINPNQNLAHFYEPKPNSLTEFESVSFKDNFGKATINSDALNERFDYQIKKDSDTFRIITLGDSYTFGWYVNTAENYPEQLEDKLNSSLKCANIKKFEVINLGVGGYDIEYAVHRFEIRGKKYDPDLVLWLLKNDDFEQIIDYVKFQGDQNYIKISEQKKLDYYKSLGIKGDPGWYDAEQELLNKVGLSTIVKYQKGKLYSISDYFNKKLVVFSPLERSLNYQNLLLKFSQERPQTFFYNSIPWVNPPEEAFPDGHPTVEGYTKIADNLFNFLVANKIIPCN